MKDGGLMRATRAFAISRRVVVWLCAVALLLNVLWLASITIPPRNGDAGFATVASTPFRQSVTAVWGPALAAGLRIGDKIDVAFNVTSGGERQRIAWVFTPFAIFWAALYSFFLFQYSTSYALANAALLTVLLALTYAALGRRLFDIGFVINRAAVFAGVSVIVVGSFVLFESLRKAPADSIESLKETILDAIGALSNKVSQALPDATRTEVQS